MLLTDDEQASGQTYMFLVQDDYFSVVTPGANRNLRLAEILPAVETLQGGTLMASLEVNADVLTAALEHAVRLNIQTVLIPSPPEMCTAELLATIDTLILNRREARLLLGLEATTREEAAAALGIMALPCRRVVVTLGEAGAVLFQDGAIYTAPALSVQVVDAVGAGDAFAGAFIANQLLGVAPAQALAMGCIAGSLAVSMLNGQASARGIEEIERLFKANYVDLCDGGNES